MFECCDFVQPFCFPLCLFCKHQYLCMLSCQRYRVHTNIDLSISIIFVDCRFHPIIDNKWEYHRAIYMWCLVKYFFSCRWYVNFHSKNVSNYDEVKNKNKNCTYFTCVCVCVCVFVLEGLSECLSKCEKHIDWAQLPTGTNLKDFTSMISKKQPMLSLATSFYWVGVHHLSPLNTCQSSWVLCVGSCQSTIKQLQEILNLTSYKNKNSKCSDSSYSKQK